jgi:hypothetical protein
MSAFLQLPVRFRRKNLKSREITSEETSQAVTTVDDGLRSEDRVVQESLGF